MSPLEPRWPVRATWVVPMAWIGLAACASDPPSVPQADRLLTDERRQYAARQADLDATARLAADAAALLVATCREHVAARIGVLETRLVGAALTLRSDFEAGAWALLWDEYPSAVERRLAPVTRRTAEAARAVEEARTAAAEKPNDARLRARVDGAEAELARAQGERLSAEREGAQALARRIETLREQTRARIDGEIARFRAALDRAGADPCQAAAAADADRIEERREAFARLHARQLEALSTIGESPGRVDVADADVAGGVGSLDRGLSFELPESVVRPNVDAELTRLDSRIRGMERVLRAEILAGLDALRADFAPTS